ncbi:MAG: hypothetical protein KGL35_23160 [Bradyrhizobium sp.]|nr:hypothetical protein [Bradyrhizobium sp.]
MDLAKIDRIFFATQPQSLQRVHFMINATLEACGCPCDSAALLFDDYIVIVVIELTAVWRKL